MQIPLIPLLPSPGGPLGCVLGSLLFIIYLFPLSSFSIFHFLSFADDTQLFLPTSTNFFLPSFLPSFLSRRLKYQYGEHSFHESISTRMLQFEACFLWKRYKHYLFNQNSVPKAVVSFSPSLQVMSHKKEKKKSGPLLTQRNASCTHTNI